jgi:hypothetical protein
MEGEAVVGILTETDLLEVLIELLATQGHCPIRAKISWVCAILDEGGRATLRRKFMRHGVPACPFPSPGGPPVCSSNQDLTCCLALLTEDYATTPAAGARILYTTTMPTGPPPAMRR